MGTSGIGSAAGHTRDISSVIAGIFLPVWGMRAYTLVDKINVCRGRIWSRLFFREALLRDDLNTRLTEFDLPVYIFVGCHDQTASPDLRRAYFYNIDAPFKGFYTLENSAHSPLFEEPGLATDILLRDVQPGTKTLADGH